MTEAQPRPAHPPQRFSLTAVAAAFVLGHAAVLIGQLLANLSKSSLSAAGSNHVSQGPWTWDGDWYVALASRGYDALPEGYRFFPVYPLIGRLLGTDPERVKWVLLVTNNLAALLALWLLVRWLSAEFPDPSSSVRAAIERAPFALGLFPAALALAWAYSEGLMLALTFAYLLLWRRKNWAGLAAIGFLAGATRPTGVLLIVIPLWDVRAHWWAAHRTSTARPTTDSGGDTPADGSPEHSAWAAAAAVLAPLAGLAAVLAWVGAATGDPWLPASIQRQLRGGFHEPITRVLSMAWSVVQGSGDDAWNLLFLGLAVASLWFGRRVMPRAVSMYGIATLVVATSAVNVDSLGRYALACPPLTLGWALATDRPICNRALLVAGFVGTVGFTWLAATGTVVP